MPRSRLTGTQKKAQKAEIKFTKQLQKDFLKTVGSRKTSVKTSLQELQDILSGKHLPTTSLQDLQKDLLRAKKGAEEFYAPIKEQALHEFGTETVPGIYGHFGSEMGARSSALNQALAAARENLSRQLASDFAGFQSNYAQNLLQQREQNRLGALQSRLQTAGLGLGQGVQPIQTGIGTMNPYQDRSTGPSTASTLLGAGIGALGTIGGSLLGGPVGAALGGMAARGATKAIGLGGTNQL